MFWVRNDKTGELYPSRQDAAKALGICVNYVSNLIRGSKESPNYSLSMYDDGIDCPREVSPKQEVQSRCPGTRQTKCADCANYRCNWIQKLEPVPGWDAVEVPENKSYIVRECPEFKINERRKYKE